MFPTPLPYQYSMADALPHLAGQVEGGAGGEEPAPEGEGGSEEEAQLDDVDQILASLENDEDEGGSEDEELEELEEFFVKRKGGRPKEGLKFGTDKHPLGRDPLGDKERRGALSNRTSESVAKRYIGELTAKRTLIKEAKSILDDENIIEDGEI
jgi:hypothetical protein